MEGPQKLREYLTLTKPVEWATITSVNKNVLVLRKKYSKNWNSLRKCMIFGCFSEKNAQIGGIEQYTIPIGML